MSALRRGYIFGLRPLNVSAVFVELTGTARQGRDGSFSATSSEYSGRESVKIFNRQGVLSRRAGGIDTLAVDGENSRYL